MKWDAISKRLPKKDGIIYGCEVGTWQGQNAEQLLKINSNLFLYCVDQWKADDPEYIDTKDGLSIKSQSMFDDAKAKTIERTSRFKNRIKIIQDTSINAVNKFRNEFFDFVFIDANHGFEAVIQDIALWLPKIKSDGWICGHDFGVYAGVKKAVFEMFPEYIVELDSDFTWFVQV